MSRRDPIDWLGILFWSLVTGLFLALTLQEPSLLNAGLVLYYAMVVFFLLKRRAQRRGAPWSETIFAWVGAILPMFIVQLHPSGVLWLGSVVQLIALALTLYSLYSLGYSFGIAPADRGLVKSGPYRFIRHPLYASEILFFLGYLISSPTWRNTAAFAIALVVDIVRIEMEEKVLDGYTDYKEEVRWRLIPWVY
jgi:protein-S-isoprenylcysteine O-methyltransferase Ste14